MKWEQCAGASALRDMTATPEERFFLWLQRPPLRLVQVPEAAPVPRDGLLASDARTRSFFERTRRQRTRQAKPSSTACSKTYETSALLASRGPGTRLGLSIREPRSRNRGSTSWSSYFDSRSEALARRAAWTEIRRHGIRQSVRAGAPDWRAHWRAHPANGFAEPKYQSLENRYPSLGGSRVEILPPPLFRPFPAQPCGRWPDRLPARKSASASWDQ